MKNDVPDCFLRMDESALKSALVEAGAVFKGRTIRCPFHDDRNPSGSIYQGEDRVWRFKCHGCGLCEDVIGVQAKAAGKQSADLLREARREVQPEPPRKVRTFASLDALKSAYRDSTIFTYANPDTRAAEMVVVRYVVGGKKRFSQLRPDGAGFAEQAPPKPWPIYNRARVRAAEMVVVVEGEKCVHALHEVGFVATTSPGGAGKAPHADWSPLAGKRVVLWADNDEPGTGHMKGVADALAQLDPSPLDVRLVDHAAFDLPDHGDAVDFLAQYGEGDRVDGNRAVLAAIDSAQPVCGGGSESLRQRIDDIVSGRLRSVAWPWRGVTHLSKSLLPGTVTSICADPGAGKSFLGLESLAYWEAAGVKPAAFMLEDGQDYHLNRVLAQLEENGDYADIDWIKANAESTASAYARHRAFLDRLAPRLDATDEPIGYDALLAWIERRAKQGCRVLLIDPITAAEADQQRPWSDDKRFIISAKALVRRFGCSLVLMTHPRTGKGGTKGGTLSDMAGGAAFPRFSHCVFWLDRHDEPKKVTVAGPVGDFITEINRTLRMSKTRNGRGAGLSLGFNFNHTLRFAEQGVVRKTNARQMGDDDPFVEPQKPRIPIPSRQQDPFANEAP